VADNQSYPTMTSEISKLVTAAQTGDRAAFEQLVKLTYAETYTLALRLTNNDDDAADVVQDAYLRAYRSIGNFRGDAQFTTWLYRITANCASTSLTKRKRHRHDELNEETPVPADAAAGPEAKTSAALDRHDLSQALAKLPPNLRAVIVLRDIYDLPHEAIAAELGISEVTAKVRLHRARKKLRDQLLPPSGEETHVQAV
jgi:RNA polymerase sigma-70 factor, ECF subfamily